MKFKINAVILFFALLLIVLSCAYIWSINNSAFEIQKHLDIVGSCGNINEVIALMGKPYEVYEKFPPKLGGHLLNSADDSSAISVYAFTVRKIPPVFIVVKTSKDGKIIRVGHARS